jgi:hypothetical protein
VYISGKKRFLFAAALLVGATAQVSSAKAQQDLTALQRAAQFGISDIRGVGYIPGPDGPQKPIDPSFGTGDPLPYFKNVLQTYEPNRSTPYCQPHDPPYQTCHPLDATYTIYYDSDFYNADFKLLWGNPGGSEVGRNDLGRYKSELNANFVYLYDWNQNTNQRDHIPFLDYAHSLGMKVTIAISNYTYEIMCGRVGGVTDWKSGVKSEFNEVYANGSTKPHPAAGVLKIFNEYDGSVCENPDFVAQVALYWKQLEEARGVPDADRMPIIFPTTFGIKNRLAGGAGLDVFNAINSTSGLGLSFWKARVVFATNPFNDGPFMKNWLDTDLPNWFAIHNIPADTPVMFGEYGRSSDESNPPTEAGQAAWVKGQFDKVYLPKKPAGFLGAVAFINEYRFWLKPPEPNFALTDFNRGGGTWNKPPAKYVHHQLYQNPNARQGSKWDAYYQVDPQKPRPAYCEIAKVYFGIETPPTCP